ncbi:MAG: hypothetical protein ACRD21_02565 [Vicinamibacteria bacterium]
MHRITLSVFASALCAQLPSNAHARDDTRPRVFVVESESWSMGDELGVADFSGADIIGGAKPQTAEIVKTVHERCPELVVTRKEDRADYVLVLEHEGGKVLVRKDNKFAVYDAEGDAIASGSTRTLGNAVKDACKAIVLDWDEAQY